MKTRFSKLMAIVMVFALIVAFAAIPASAYTAIQGTSTTFNKYLILDEDAKVPDVTFTYTIAPGDAVAARAPGTNGAEDKGTVAILAGIGTPSVGSAVFKGTGTNPDVPVTTEISGVTLETGKGHVDKTVTIDFSGITFSEPGIYRYVLTEQENAYKGISYDITNNNNKTRFLDVYVNDSDGVLSVGNYVLHKTATEIEPNNTSGSNAYSGTEKSVGFVNEFESANLEFGKEVIGNQGSKDKYFKFTLAITNAQPNTEYNLVRDADATIAANAATKTDYSGKTNPTSFTTDANGAATVEFYLHDGQYITVKDLPYGSVYSVTEDEEDYFKREGIQENVATHNSAIHTGAISGTMTDANVYTGFTNERNGIVPTGVLLTVAPFAIGLLLFGALAIFFIARKKKRAEEE